MSEIRKCLNEGCPIEGSGGGFFCTTGCLEQWLKAGGKLSVPGSLEAEARTIIQGDRRDSYGPAKQSFENIAATWTAHMSQMGILKAGARLKGRDVAVMMAAFKLLRESAKPKRDNLVDAMGYSMLIEEIDKAQ
jgi:hypothetical protein